MLRVRILDRGFKQEEHIVVAEQTKLATSRRKAPDTPHGDARAIIVS